MEHREKEMSLYSKSGIDAIYFTKLVIVLLIKHRNAFRSSRMVSKSYSDTICICKTDYLNALEVTGM